MSERVKREKCILLKQGETHEEERKRNKSGAAGSYQNDVVFDIVLVKSRILFQQKRTTGRPTTVQTTCRWCLSELHTRERPPSHADDTPFKRHVVSPIHRTTCRLNHVNDSASKPERRVARPSSPDDRSFDSFFPDFPFLFLNHFSLNKLHPNDF